MRIEKTIDINAPPERVWPYLTESEKILQWYITFKRFEYTSSQRSGVGTPIYIEEQAIGPIMKMEFTISEWEENERLAIRMTKGSAVRLYEQEWSLEPIPLGTRFVFMEEIVFPFGVLGRLLGIFAQRVSQATVEKMQRRLKELIEA